MQPRRIDEGDSGCVDQTSGRFFSGQQSETVGDCVRGIEVDFTGRTQNGGTIEEGSERALERLTVVFHGFYGPPSITPRDQESGQTGVTTKRGGRRDR